MEQARNSSGIYETRMGQSTHSFGSGASLREHAAAPAGHFTSTRAGVIPSQNVSGWEDQPEVPTVSSQNVPHQPFYKKRWFIISQIILIPLVIALLFILLFPVVRAIIALVLKRTNIDVQVAEITQPVNGSFALKLEGTVFNTGIINAKIHFTEATNVSWIEDDGTETELGYMQLQDLSTKHKRAIINDITQFIILNQTAFGRFSENLITAQNFTWRLPSHLMLGFNSFDGNVILQDLQLPSDDPAGGIHFAATTQLNNPSPFSLDLGTVVFGLTYKNVSLGIGTGTETKIAPGNNSITLKGTLIRQTDPSNLASVSELFTNYLNGDSSPVIATGQSTLQDDGSTISWLSQGLEALHLTVPFKSSNDINPIKAINIGNLALQFDASQPWSPAVESNSVQASLELPFGFNVAINEIQNDFVITKDGNSVAGVSTPIGASTSSISVIAPTDTTGTINISIEDTRLDVPDDQHAIFSSFNEELTTSDVAQFRLIGTSRAVANTSIGQITLDAIKVNVSSSLNGLRGLKGMTTIDTVDVTGGTTDAISLAIEVTIDNPSSLILSTGDLTLQLLRDGAIIGTTLLPNLTLNLGNNTINTLSSFEANKSPQGLQTLNDFISKEDTHITIAGFDGSTQVPSLADAFKALSLDVILPGLKTNLINSASLKVLPTTGKENNISHVTVSLSNPFSAPLQITKISSNVTSFGILLGSIDQDISFESSPKSSTDSPVLDFNLNFDPSSLFTVTRALAVEAGEDVAPLDSIVQLGGIHYLPITQPTSNNQARKRQGNLFSGFDLTNFVRTAFNKLKSDINISTDVTIGQYATTLAFSQAQVATSTDQSLDLILPILAAPIVQKIVGGSILGLDTVIIIDPSQNTFKTQLKGSISNAGPFDAVISFPSGLTISWLGKPIGKVSMNDITVTGDVGGIIDTETTFTVVDVDHLTDFTKALLTTESFDWEISGDNLTVRALGISVPDISFSSRTVTLKGFDGLKDGVQIQSFDLPFDDPSGGIHLTIQATASNPSQVGIQLSSLGFDTFIGNINIASVAAGPVTLAPGATSQLSLVGRLLPQGSDEGLLTISNVFNNFVHGKNSDVVVHGASAGSPDVTWLNEGIKVLQVATVLPNQGPQTIIKSISLNELSLSFSRQAPFGPITSSKSTDAAFTLPFGFPLDITALEQTITLGFEGSDFAQLVIPKGPSQTDIGPRIIHINFEKVPFSVFDNGHNIFEKFLAATTIGSEETLRLSGSANADAKTAVGLLSLSGIDFAVDSTIAGLQGLNARPVTVSNLDVNHGFSDFLLINVDSALFNPSNLTIGTGDVSFSLQFQDQNIGTADLSNLVILPGNNSYPIAVHYAPQGEALEAGQALLQNFIQGIDAVTAIGGSTSSTPIESLQLALSQIHLSPVTIPGLHQNLITSASLTFPIDVVSTGVASTSFSLSNPFTASVNILRLGATATFHGLTLGTIPTTDTSPHPISAPGHGDVSSPVLPFNFNLDPSSIIQLLLATSQQSNVDLGPLVQLFQFVLSNPDFRPPVTTTVDTNSATCVSGHQFDADTAILQSLAELKVDLNIDSSIKLDDFLTDLSFVQSAVPALTDKTALFLIGAVAGPITQHLVDGSVLAFTEADITNLSNNGFDLALKGSLTNIGPLDALITFTEPLNVNFQGKDIATITLPPICAAANVGVPDYQSSARLTITDNAAFTEFAVFLLHNPSFDWTISTPKLRVNALGTIFENVSLSKIVTFKAFNGLPGVTISNFQLPSDDPVGGIHIETDATIPSQAQLGIDLGTVSFQSFFDGTFVGPLSATNLILKANSGATTHLSGRIVPQSDNDLAVMGKLFSQFLNGQNVTLQTTGDSVLAGGSNVPIDWLSTAFKTLTLDVILPGEKLEVIQAIDLNDLEVTMKTADQAFAPPTSSLHTVAHYKNPFGFSLQVIEAAQTIILGTGGQQVAQLVIPQAPADGGVSTGNIADLNISFIDIPLESLDPTGFASLLSEVTLKPDVEIEVTGTADVTARTTIGNIPITGIPLNVVSDLKGIASFGGMAALSNVTITGSGGDGGNQFIVAPLTTTLQNPSQISLDTIGVSLPVIFSGVTIGRAVIDEFNLVPGTNVVNTEFHYQPANSNDTIAQAFLSEFLQTGDTIGLTIHGDANSSPFASLSPALSGLQLSTQLTGLNQPTFITNIVVTIDLNDLDLPPDQPVFVDVDFTIHNPLDVEITLDFVQSDAGVDGEVFAIFSQGFDNFVVPPGGTADSGTFGGVLLTQGLLNSLAIVPLLELDVAAAATITVGPGGYQIPFLKLQQTGVPTQYNLGFGDDLVSPAKAKQIAQSASASASDTKSSTISPESSALSSTSGGKVTGATSNEGTMDKATRTIPTPESSTEATLVKATASSVIASSDGPVVDPGSTHAFAAKITAAS
ncbi:hypothetical protein JR316_0002199 [Psilocybe cubensis]|uniref:Uncharacterized protein n=2 Tax=Psilocybe cubensis TaxID=181762 RepID=A0ACB8HCT2_PSICU|nr:hypothetical protein JR316_0002199 [Psilocybe cubensis]KAH9485291.1 hypothetical protein JR316_0002199 [Psilocybe cubensis]